MHVLVITPVYPHPGSPAEGLFNEQHALALIRAGIQVSVVVCKPWLPNWLAEIWKRYNSLVNLPEFEERDGIQIVYARYFHIPQYQVPKITVDSCAHSILRVVNEIRLARGFDIIQIHDAWPVGLAAPTIAQSLGRPFILTMHIQDDPRLHTGRRGAALYEIMMKRASKVITVGRPLERFARNWIPELAHERLHLVPNGVNLSDAETALQDMAPKQNGWGHIISVSNLWPVKGIDLNLRALKQLAQAGVPWERYTIVGEGPEKPRLRILAGELGIEDRVHFTGRLSHHEVFKEMCKADIFSLPSWQEAFGIVYLEAMACGKPTVGCHGQGAEDIIEHEKNGLLVAPRDVHGLASTLQKLLENPGYSRKLGDAALLRVKEFTWERNAKQYVHFYRNICNSSIEARRV
jgi:glycosyltransferase involved in cell wall biosynthesis